MASVRGMTPEAILALIKRELANVKLSEDQIRDLIQTNTDIVDSIVNLEDQVQAGLTGEALDQLNLELQQLRSELQTQAAALAAADTTLQENAQTLIDNQVEMALLSVLLSDEGFLNTEAIKPGTITGDHIAAQTVSALNIAAGAIVSEKIAADAITANHILAESITGDRLAARTVGADRLVADSITANEISSRAITTNELAVGAVSAENISAEGISADLITAGSLSATRVELAGNDLASQMDFILSEIDRKFNGVLDNVEQLNRTLLDDMAVPKFNILYGDLNVPNNAYAPFAKWLNTSYSMSSRDGTQILIDLRAERIDNHWVVKFSRSFEGRIQTYSGGQFVAEYIQDPSTDTYPVIQLTPIDQIIWYSEAHTPYIYRWVQGFNVGGAQPRNPSNGYGYTMPHRVPMYSNDDRPTIMSKISGVVSTDMNVRLTRGTEGGKSFLRTRLTNLSEHEHVYSQDMDDQMSWFAPVFAVRLQAPARAITINARMHIGQPRRADKYGFAVFKNDTLVDYVVEGGIGSLTGGSVLFSHEDVHMNLTLDTPLYTEDIFYLFPIVLEVIPGPVVTAFVMDWEVTITTVR